MSAITRRFSTGLSFLDQRIDGGLVPGGLLALTAPPTSQSDLLLSTLTSARRTVFVSTGRSAAEIRNWAESKSVDQELIIHATSPEVLLDAPEEITSSLPPESFLILDSTNELEARSRERYHEFINHLKEQFVEKDSIGISHCIDQQEHPPLRRLTLHRADYVWQIELLVLSREIKTRLLITKARRGRALTEPIPLRLTDRVQIDTSRRIS